MFLISFQCFETEAELRLQGKPKTPDVLLMVPLAVRLPNIRGTAMTDVDRKRNHDSSGSLDTPSEIISVVHWIDSKGM